MSSEEHVLKWLAGSQHENGAFSSLVCSDNQTLEDHNGFITALVLLNIHQYLISTGMSLEIKMICHRALDYLQRCEQDDLPGVYRFWPVDESPAWIKDIPPDLDDTALYTQALLLYGRLSRTVARNNAADIFSDNQVNHQGDHGIEWIKKGAYYTWVNKTSTTRPNVVDCVVNANIVTLLALLDLKFLPGYQSACEMISSAIAWAGDSSTKARALMPFYPDTSSLKEAVARAIQSGAVELSPAFKRLTSAKWSTKPAGVPVICASAYGYIYWKAPVLAKISDIYSSRSRLYSAEKI